MPLTKEDLIFEIKYIISYKVKLWPKKKPESHEADFVARQFVDHLGMSGLIFDKKPKSSDFDVLSDRWDSVEGFVAVKRAQGERFRLALEEARERYVAALAAIGRSDDPQYLTDLGAAETALATVRRDYDSFRQIYPDLIEPSP